MLWLASVILLFVASPTRTYRLVSISGDSLPVVVAGNSAGRVDIVSGSLILRSDGSYTQRESRRSFPSAEAERILGQRPASNTYTREAGTYLVRDTLIILTPYADTTADEVPYVGSIHGRIVEFESDGSFYVYRQQLSPAPK